MSLIYCNNDVVNNKKWVECSEPWFSKYQAFKMPNCYDIMWHWNKGCTNRTFQRFARIQEIQQSGDCQPFCNSSKSIIYQTYKSIVYYFINLIIHSSQTIAMNLQGFSHFSRTPNYDMKISIFTAFWITEQWVSYFCPRYTSPSQCSHERNHRTPNGFIPQKVKDPVARNPGRRADHCTVK